jgi:hypothetical protein
MDRRLSTVVTNSGECCEFSYGGKLALPGLSNGPQDRIATSDRLEATSLAAST